MSKTYTINSETITRSIGFLHGPKETVTRTRHTVLEDGVSIAITDDLAEAEEIRAEYEAAKAERQALIAELGEEGYARLIDENSAG